MPRRDPKNERGPKVGHRQRTRKPCANCPPEVAEIAAKSVPVPQDVMSATGQGTALWSHVGIGTGTCIAMIERYADNGLPGDPRKMLRKFRDRLDTVINKLEESNANHTPTE